MTHTNKRSLIGTLKRLFRWATEQDYLKEGEYPFWGLKHKAARNTPRIVIIEPDGKRD